jgi:hypothetical protein
MAATKRIYVLDPMTCESVGTIPPCLPPNFTLNDVASGILEPLRIVVLCPTVTSP